MQKAHKLIFLLALITVCGVLINAVQNNDSEQKETVTQKTDLKQTSDSYNIKAIKIPEDLTFAGERVPLEKHDIKERIDRELLVNTYWQSNALLWIKRTNKYFPIIEPILKEKGVPDDFLSLIHI